jgi:tetratricopeptide (TPR) repeat protein
MTKKATRWVTAIRLALAVTITTLLGALIVAWVTYPVPDPWQQVRDLLAHGKQEQAEEKIRELDPTGTNWRTHWLRARIYRYAGKMHEARVELQEALRMGGDVETLEREQLFCLAVSGRMSEAEHRLNHLLLDPRGDAAEIARSYALGFYLVQRFKKANQLISAWRKDEPDNAEPWFLEALAFDFTNHTPEAIDSMRQGLELDPSRWQMRLLLAHFLEAAGKYDDAFLETEAVYAQRPNEPEAIYSLGSLGLEFGELELATECLEKLRQIPNVESRLFQLEAQVADAKRDWPAAESSARRVLERRPKHVEAMTLLARALAAQGKMEEAETYRETIQESIQRLQNVQNLTDELNRSQNRSDLLVSIGDESRTAELDDKGYYWYRAAVESDPLCKRGHERLARHYREIGNIGLAEEHEQKAKKCPDRPSPTLMIKRGKN